MLYLLLSVLIKETTREEAAYNPSYRSPIDGANGELEVDSRSTRTQFGEEVILLNILDDPSTPVPL